MMLSKQILIDNIERDELKVSCRDQIQRVPQMWQVQQSCYDTTNNSFYFRRYDYAFVSVSMQNTGKILSRCLFSRLLCNSFIKSLVWDSYHIEDTFSKL